MPRSVHARRLGPGDICTPSPGNQGTSPEHLPDRVPVGPLPTELHAPGGAGLGWLPPAAPHGSVSVLCPAATLKSKQDELHRKALQTLER